MDVAITYASSTEARLNADLFDSVLLTCKLQKSVPTKYGAKTVLCFALVHPVVGDHAGIGDN